MDQAWRRAWERWGDPLWSLALVRWGNRATAQQALVRAFERVYSARTLPTDPYTALLHALLHGRRRFLLPTRARALPRALRRMPPMERTLLALWLVEDGTGEQLLAVSGWTHQTLVQRFANALRPWLPRRDPARRTKVGQAAFAQWLAHQLNLPDSPLPDTLAPTTLANWQHALNQVRDIIKQTTAPQHAPNAMRDALETALMARDDAMPDWQRTLGWLALAGLVAAGVWIMRPSFAAPPATRTAAPSASVDARAVVEDALNTWSTPPVSGTLHRQVWAIDPASADTPALVTDVWLQANSARYRVETTRDSRLVEWQLGDGIGTLQSAARDGYSSCQWGDGPSVRGTLVFNADASQQQRVRDARLQHGAYGRGYQMLRTALSAADLRSWGTRTENNTPVLLLGYTDPAQPNHHRVLVFDARTRRLQVVRALISDAAQSSARDLWRVQHEDVSAGDVSTTLPRRPRNVVKQDQVFAPACLELNKDHLISLRALIGSKTGWWLPTRMPPGVQAAALISDDVVTPQTAPSQQSQPGTWAVFVGGERTLRVGVQQTSFSLEHSVARGPWRVLFTENQRTMRAQLCAADDALKMCPPTQTSVVIEAQNWTEEQLLNLIDSLAPASAPSTWRALDRLFLDPAPLDPQVQQVLAHALDRMAVAQGVVHSTAEITRTRRALANGVADLPNGLLPDPYAVPQQWLEPEHFTLEQTMVLSNTDVQQARTRMRLPDGTLVYAQTMNDNVMVAYDAVEQTKTTIPLDQNNGWRQMLQVQGTQAFDRVQAFASTMLPITLRDAGDAWVLEQQTSNPDPYHLNKLMGRSVLVRETPASDSYIERVWIDKQTSMLRRAEVVQKNGRNGETVLSALHTRGWQAEPLGANANLTLPSVPPGTLAVAYGSSGPEVTSPLEPFLMSPQEWVWRQGFEVLWRDTHAPSVGQALGSPEERVVVTAYILGNNVEQLASVGLIHSTTYRVGNTTVAVRQGAAPLLRYALRSQSLSDNGVPGWEHSRAVKVTVGGQERTAWLLEGRTDTALVVDVDGVIVHISSSDKAYIEGALLDALPHLEFVDAAAWEGDH